MKNAFTFLSAFVVTVALCGSGRAAEPSSAAKVRAVLYQKEARAVLIQRQWQISRDESGKLVVDHPVAPTGANFGYPGSLPAVAWLTIIFQPESVSHTICVAHSVMYIYMHDGNRVNPKPLGPLPFDTPEVKKLMEGVMAQAEKQMISRHPEFAVR